MLLQKSVQQRRRPHPYLSVVVASRYEPGFIDRNAVQVKVFGRLADLQEVHIEVRFACSFCVPLNQCDAH